LAKRLTGGEIRKARISSPAATCVPAVTRAQPPSNRAVTDADCAEDQFQLAVVVGRRAVGVQSHTSPENYIVDARNLDQQYLE